MKKRILLVNESSVLSTGYANYGRELLSRLVKNPNYEIAELGCLVDQNHPGIKDLPWKFFPGVIDTPAFHADQTNRWGQYVFGDVCLQFKPHFVIDVRDWWNFEWESRHPARQYFKWGVLANVDSVPQKDEWLPTFCSADAVFTFTDWGTNELKKVLGDNFKSYGAAPHCVAKEFYKRDKSQMRAKFGLPQKANIVGTVMRNQLRKLYPDLINSFAKFIDSAPKELAENTFLYIHAAYPDASWNFPKLIRDAGICSKVFFTYRCKSCGAIYSSHYQGTKIHCKFCGKQESVMPNSFDGINTETMAELFNCFDCYIQYSTCLPTGEKILTENGWKRIEHINVGENVYTHLGNWKPVVEKMERESDNYYNISIKSNYEKLKITGEHPVLGLRKIDSYPNYNTASFRARLGVSNYNGTKLPELKFNPIESFSVGDLLAYHIDDSVKDFEKIDLSIYLNPNRDLYDENKIYIKNGKSYPRFIDLDEDFCEFMGLFAADGYSDGSGVKVTLSINEQSLIKWNKDVFTKRFYKNRKALDFNYYCKPLGKFFRRFYNQNKEKQLPKELLYLPTEKQLKIIRGMFLGDGCIYNKKNKDYYISSYHTTSKQLSEDLQFLLRRLRINYSVYKIKKGGNRKDIYCFEIYFDIINNKSGNKPSGGSNIYYDNYYLMQIKSINEVKEKTKVYNLEVQDDNSYTTKICNIHNCEGQGLPTVEAGAAGVITFGQDYSATPEVVKNTGGKIIPVKRMFFESLGVDCWRALPDNDKFVEMLVSYLLKSKNVRDYDSHKIIKLTNENYNWDKTVAAWSRFFDTEPLDKWETGVTIKVPNLNVPSEISNFDFVNWCLEHVAGRKDMKNSHIATKLGCDLNDGTSNRELVLNWALDLYHQAVAFEKARLSLQ